MRPCGGHRGQHQLGGDVAGGVDAGHRGAVDPVDDHGAALVGPDAQLLEAEAAGPRHLADGEQHVAALHGAAVLQVDHPAVADPLDLGGPGVLHRPQPPALEHVLDDHGGVVVLGGQDAVTADHEGHLGAEAQEGGGVLGPGGPGPDDHQVLGHLAQLVDVLAGQDDLAVGGRGVHAPGADRWRRGWRRPQPLHAPVGLAHLHGVGPDDPGPPQHHPRPVGHHLADVLGLGERQVVHPGHDGRQVDLVAGHLQAHHPLEVHPEAGRRLQRVERLRRGQQGLGRHAVPQHAGAAQPLVADDRDLGPQLGRDQGGLVAARSPPTITTRMC